MLKKTVARIWYSVKLRVEDPSGNPIVGATISIKDNTDTEVTVETISAPDADGDELSDKDSVTGPFTTDANGEIGYWIASYEIHGVDQVENLPLPPIFRDNTPFDIKITATGFPDVLFKAHPLTEATNWIVAMVTKPETRAVPITTIVDQAQAVTIPSQAQVISIPRVDVPTIPAQPGTTTIPDQSQGVKL